MATDITPRQAALWWASKGYPVLPLHGITEDLDCTCGSSECHSPGKHPYAPLAPNGLKDATVELDVVRSWFTAHHWLHFGVRCDDLLVIDVDPRNGGDKTWTDLTTTPTRPLISTWQVRTGGGGLHVIFKNPTNIPSGKLDKGIELKATANGYIVGVQCGHKSGKAYAWVQFQSPADVGLMSPPDWLLECIKTRTYLGRVTPPEEWRRIARARLQDGDRHNTLLRLAGHLIATPGVDPIEIRELLIGWDEGRCDPPLGAKEIVGLVDRLAERELQKRKWL